MRYFKITFFKDIFATFAISDPFKFATEKDEKREELKQLDKRKQFSINTRLWIHCFAKRNMYTGFIYLLLNVDIGLATVITGI